MNALRDDVAIVTGGAAGVGRALCEALCRRGATVIVADIDGPAAESVAASLAREGCRARALELDVSSADAVAAGVDAVVAEFGRIDWIFNNAGIVVGGEVQDIDTKAWRRIVDVNFLGVVHGTHAAYRHMLRQGSGHIVNVASMYGLFPGILVAPYVATKHAVVGMSLALRSEARRQGVRVTAVCPGFIRTGLLRSGHYSGGFNGQGIEQRIPFPFADAESAAARILRELRRNRAIVVFPLYARITWWIYRLSPQLMIFINRLATPFYLKRMHDQPS
jgi:NAD(P)-dependent dehydrogenase (short-subunit alcohol dehydrogenase family)